MVQVPRRRHAVALGCQVPVLGVHGDRAHGMFRRLLWKPRALDVIGECNTETYQLGDRDRCSRINIETPHFRVHPEHWRCSP
jgi:hypothetical protein